VVVLEPVNCLGVKSRGTRPAPPVDHP
jgi:hypothetical protein